MSWRRLCSSLICGDDGSDKEVCFVCLDCRMVSCFDSISQCEEEMYCSFIYSREKIPFRGYPYSTMTLIHSQQRLLSTDSR